MVAVEVYFASGRVKKVRPAHVVGRVVGAFGCETGFARSLPNEVIFYDARAGGRAIALGAKRLSGGGKV